MLIVVMDYGRNMSSNRLIDILDDDEKLNNLNKDYHYRQNIVPRLEKLYKNDTITHSRNTQITNVMTQRLRVINEKDSRYKLSKKYFEFLKKRTKEKDDKKRKQLNFKI